VAYIPARAGRGLVFGWLAALLWFMVAAVVSFGALPVAMLAWSVPGWLLWVATRGALAMRDTPIPEATARIVRNVWFVLTVTLLVALQVGDAAWFERAIAPLFGTRVGLLALQLLYGVPPLALTGWAVLALARDAPSRSSA
jgi:hypothetical protein